MTCIIGLETKNGVMLGADSAVSNGGECSVKRHGKIHRVSNHLIGVSGTSRVDDVIRYHLKLPRYESGPVHRHMTTVVCPALTSAIREHFSEWNDKDIGRWYFVIGVGGAVFEVDRTGHAGHYRRGYVTAGCGSTVALGAMYATHGMPPRRRIRLALEAAAEHLEGVRAPFTIMEMKK